MWDSWPPNRDVAEADAQAAVDVVSAWSKKWELNLNATVSEASFFSNWTGESKWQPTIKIGGKAIKFEPHPRLLGVVLDRQLTFAKHTENMTKAAASPCRVLAALDHTEYGWRKQDRATEYHSVV